MYGLAARRLTIVVAASALLLAGCGGGGSAGGGGVSLEAAGAPLTKAPYRAQLLQISTDVSTRLKQTTGTSSKLAKKDLPKLQAALRSFADELAKVNPPTEVADLHARLVSTMRSLADELPGIVDKLDKAKDASEGIAAFLGAKSIQALLALGEEFKAKGYDISKLTS
jgi:hypothetical protein